jgi:hypothetical protein
MIAAEQAGIELAEITEKEFEAEKLHKWGQL